MKIKNLIAACPMALEIDKKPYAFLVAAEIKIPMQIGCNVKPCPECGEVMSFAYGHYFCRGCGFDESLSYS